jgi:molybdopterin converting factor small subunit
MICTVRLFARARDLAASDVLRIELEGRKDVRELREKMIRVCPALASLLPRCAIAIDEEFASDDVRVPIDATIAVLPPVSGGSKNP